MITYVLMVSRVFPATHKRKGDETHFEQKIKTAIEQSEEIDENGACFPGMWDFDPKPHTIRANYPIWEKRIKAIQEGKAILSIRYWEGIPYNSKQVEILQLDKDYGIGVQKVWLDDNISIPEVINDCEECGSSGTVMIAKLYPNGHTEVEETCDNCNGEGCTFDKIDAIELAKNDGLSYADFKDWFKGYDLSNPMVIIHFTKFRY